MNEMTNIIDLFCNESSKSYRFHKEDDIYEITDNDSNVGATIDADEGEIQYFVTGVYNSGCDWAEIDLEALEDMKKLCETLRNDMKNRK